MEGSKHTKQNDRHYKLLHRDRWGRRVPVVTGVVTGVPSLAGLTASN